MTDQGYVAAGSQITDLLKIVIASSQVDRAAHHARYADRAVNSLRLRDIARDFFRGGTNRYRTGCSAACRDIGNSCEVLAADCRRGIGAGDCLRLRATEHISTGDGETDTAIVSAACDSDALRATKGCGAAADAAAIERQISARGSLAGSQRSTGTGFTE